MSGGRFQLPHHRQYLFVVRHHFDTSFMLDIDKTNFISNLYLTQAYCCLQMENSYKDYATIFRSFNPIYKNKNLFTFKISNFGFEIEPNLKYCNLTNWTTNPTERENWNLVDKLFEQQIEYKKASLKSSIQKQKHAGRILVSQFYCTLIDGASAIQSLGLIDDYDLPPVDTWFYLSADQESRLMFAWIPTEYEYYADQAVLVNCLDIINWFDNWLPEDYDFIMQNTNPE